MLSLIKEIKFNLLLILGLFFKKDELKIIYSGKITHTITQNGSQFSFANLTFENESQINFGNDNDVHRLSHSIKKLFKIKLLN